MITTATGGSGPVRKSREKSRPRYKEIGDELRMQIAGGSCLKNCRPSTN